MHKRNICRGIVLCTVSAMLVTQSPSIIWADEETSFDVNNGDEETGGSEETPEGTSEEIPEEIPEEVEPEVTPSPDPDEPGQDEKEDSEKEETTTPTEEKKEVLPISAGISVSGEAGNLTLVLTVTNGIFINENIPDFKAVFSWIPEGVSIDVTGQTENTVTFHIHGNAGSYTKNDLVMVIPSNWLKNTADEVVQTETKIEGHDLYWCAHADFGIRLKSKAETVDNAAFIAQQNLTVNTADYDTFRFVYKEMEVKYFIDRTDILEYPAEDARVVGQALWNQAVYEIVPVEDGWAYVESGQVRGFVRQDQIAEPEKDQRILVCNTAKELIEAKDNKAYDFLRVTAYDRVIKEIPRITKKNIEIKEEKKKDSRTVGTIQENGLVYWLSSEADSWVYVESGDVRGFVKEQDLLSAKKSAKQVKKNGKAAYALAEESVEPAENKALYYKMTSIKSGNMEGFYREQIVELAKTYIGNPYVYGGTDPNNGIDCSAFMQYLYGTYGISLPRTSKSQGFVATMITLDSIDKGDLIIYADDAEIYHVVMYAGDGKTVEAADESQGIVSKAVNTVNAVWGISLLDGYEEIELPAVMNKPAYEYETREAYEKRLKEGI